MKSSEAIADLDGFDDVDDFSSLVPTTTSNKLSQQHGWVKLHILTVLNGMNAGNHFVLRMQPSEGRALVKCLQTAVERARARHVERMVAESEGSPCVAVTRHRIRRVYEDFRVQFLVCAVVLLGFIVDMTEAQYLPDRGTTMYSFYMYADVGFTFFFTCEVLFNMISNSSSAFPYVDKFFSNFLNLFDFLHAGASIASVVLMMYTNYGAEGGTFIESFPALKMLRLARLMRILKLFRRIQTLNKILHSVAKAALGLANAMALLFTFCIVYGRFLHTCPPTPTPHPLVSPLL